MASKPNPFAVARDAIAGFGADLRSSRGSPRRAFSSGSITRTPAVASSSTRDPSGTRDNSGPIATNVGIPNDAAISAMCDVAPPPLVASPETLSRGSDISSDGSSSSARRIVSARELRLAGRAASPASAAVTCAAISSRSATRSRSRGLSRGAQRLRRRSSRDLPRPSRAPALLDLAQRGGVEILVLEQADMRASDCGCGAAHLHSARLDPAAHSGKRLVQRRAFRLDALPLFRSVADFAPPVDRGAERDAGQRATPRRSRWRRRARARRDGRDRTRRLLALRQ